VAHIARQSRVTSHRSTSPLKLWVPRRPGAAAWIYATTFGGGLVSGDSVHVDMELGPNTTTVFTTQSSTKVFRTLEDHECSQQLHARVENGALLAVAPDPLVCYRGAVYRQHNQIHLEPQANLVHIDWLTSGRAARGERWQFQQLKTRLEVYRDRRLLLVDSLSLLPNEMEMTNPLRMGTHHCLASVVLLGERLAEEAASLHAEVAEEELDVETCCESVSRKAEGIIWRLVGPSTQAVGECLRRRLAFLKTFLEETPWERKW